MSILHNHVDYKFLTVKQLIEALKNTPTDSVVSVNAVGNLMVSDNEHTYIGYIDFLKTGEYVNS